MKVQQHYSGRDLPFEGDRTLLLRSIPVNASILNASITVTPLDQSGGNDPFAETIVFSGNLGDWGITKVTVSDSVEVDFHARRTLVKVSGANLQDATLQVDMGGTYVEINKNGAIKTNGDSFELDPSQGSAYLPGLTVNKFKLRAKEGTGVAPVIDSVSIRSTISNFNLRVGDLAPVWTQTGELTISKQSTDFAKLLQAYLADASTEFGYYLVPLTLHTDTIARMDIDLSVEYQLQQYLLPEGINDLTMNYQYAGVPQNGHGLLSAVLPLNARVVAHKTRTVLQGGFEDSRVAYGPLCVVAKNDGSTTELLISPASTLAQSIALSSSAVAKAVDVFMAPVTAKARLQLDIRQDLGGKPSEVSLLSIPAEFKLDRASSASASWYSVPLAEELRLDTQRYWIVIQSVEGEAVWLAEVLASDNMAAQNSNNGGLSWRKVKVTTSNNTVSVATFYRLRYKPDQFKMPVSLEIGAIDNAKSVDLTRYEPLGRVEFTLDSPDVSAAFNDYIANVPEAVCSELEYVANGDFNESLRLGAELTYITNIPLSHDAQSHMVISRDGNEAFLASLEPNEIIFSVIDLARNEPLDELSFGIGSYINYIGSMSISPDSSRVYLVLENNHIAIIDTNNKVLIGYKDLSKTQIMTGTFSADGRYWYALRYNKSIIEIFDTEMLERVVLETGNGLEDAKVAVIALGGDQSLIDVKRGINSKGHACLYVLTMTYSVTTGRGQFLLYQVDTERNVVSKGPLIVANFNYSLVGVTSLDTDTVLAATPCSHTLAMVNRLDDSVIIIDTLQWQTRSLSIPTDLKPRIALFANDGERLYIAGVDVHEANVIYVIDVKSRQSLAHTRLNMYPLAIAAAVIGDRIYIAGSNTNSIDVIATSPAQPAEWEILSGQASLLCSPAPFDKTMLLGISQVGQSPQFTELAQLISIRANCLESYRLSFWGISSGAEANAIVSWHDDSGKELHRDVLEITEIGVNLNAALSESSFVFHEFNIDAINNATQVELRFEAHGGYTIIDKISFIQSTETVSNTDLVVDSSGLPTRWQQQPIAATGFNIIPASQHTTFTNTGFDPVVLFQQMQIVGKQVYLCKLLGQSTLNISEATPPRIEVAWHNADGAAVGEVIGVEISPFNFTEHLAVCIAPDKAVSAELRLIVPENTSFQVSMVSLSDYKTVNVQQTFLSQAPGELTVTEAMVVYDLVKPAPLAVTQIPTPSAVAGSTDSANSKSVYCSSCQSKQMLTETTVVRTVAGRPALAGICESCGAQLFHLGGILKTNAPVLGKTYPAKALPIVTSYDSKRQSVDSPKADKTITPLPVVKPIVSKMARQKVGIIAGIGESIGQKLIDANIKTIGKLADISPDKKIDGISPIKLLELKAAAELVLSTTASSKVFSALSDDTLSSALAYSSTELSNMVNCPVELVEQFQRRIRALLLLLDNDVFKELKVNKVLT